MGLFDLGINKEISSKRNKEEISTSIEKKLKKFSIEEPTFKNKTLILNDFRTSILKYNLSIDLEKTPKGFNILIDGELQQLYVIILVVLIILSILLTYGIGVIFIVLFAYLQKHSATKFINSIIDDISYL